MSELFPNIPDDEPMPNMLLIGLPGAGKTDALASAIEAGLDVFVIFTEAGQESLLEGCRRRGLDMNKLHWTRVKAGAPGASTLKKVARALNTGDQKSISNQRSLEKKNYRQIESVLDAMENFVDQNGVEYGSFAEWGHDKALFIDGMTGMNKMVMQMIVGGSPYRSVSDYGAAMDFEMSIVDELVNGSVCLTGVICHLEMNKDETDGRMYKLPHLLGNKNSANFGSKFSDVVLCEDTGNGWVWKTKEKGMQLKARNLPYSTNIKPGFKQVIDAWAERYEQGKEA